MATLIVPEEYGGMTLKDIANKRGGYFPRLDLIAGQSGFKENTPLTAGQKLNLADTGSGEYQWASSIFQTPEAAAAAANKKAQEEAAAQAAAITEKENAFLNTFKTDFPEIVSGLEQELGLPTLRDVSQAAGSNLRQVQNTITDIPDVQKQATQGFDVSQNQQDRIIASELTKMAPTLEAARRTAEDASANLQFGEGQFNTKLNFALQPYELEKSFLSVQSQRDFDLLTNKLQSDLTLQLQNLQNASAIELQKLAQSGALAQIERAAELENTVSNATQIDLGDRIAFVDPSTNSIISSFNKGLSPIRGGTGVANEWVFD